MEPPGLLLLPSQKVRRMSSDTQRPLVNGHAVGESKAQAAMDDWNAKLKTAEYVAKFHGDELLADKQNVMTGTLNDIRKVLTLRNAKEIGTVGWKMATGKGLDVSFIEVVAWLLPR